MRMKIKATVLPQLVGIALGIVSMAVPWIIANHYRFVEGVRYSVDNYLFFLWGKYYTVTGSKVIQSRMILYDIGDFPLYAMIVIIIAIIIGTISLAPGRGLILNVKGRQLKLKVSANPIYLLATSTALLLFSYLYLRTSALALEVALVINNYYVEFGPSLDFLLGSVASFGIATIMTAIKYLKTDEPKSKLSKDKSVVTP